MTKQFWVIGGEYEDARFDAVRRGTEMILGPFANEARARTEWTRLTFRDGCCATQRYQIAVAELRA